jgi:dihydroxy-acid dehydratase
VETGDIITVDVAARSITLDVNEAELQRRRSQLKPPAPRFERGYGFMFAQHIGQADDGCDFDFLRSDFGGPTDEPAIF